MEDKEEMIGIELFEKRKDGFYRAGGTSMTRQEAIEKIATGWCSAISDCDACSDGGKGSKDCLRWLKAEGNLERAETVLNALLGVNK